MVSVQIDKTNQKAEVKVELHNLYFEMESDFQGEYHCAYPQKVSFASCGNSPLSFGPNRFFNAYSDLNYEQSAKAHIFASRAYENLGIYRVPFLESVRYLLKEKPYLYEKHRLYHADQFTYAIRGVPQETLDINTASGLVICCIGDKKLYFSFSPSPQSACYRKEENSLILTFSGQECSVLVNFGQGTPKRFADISSQTAHLRLAKGNAIREYNLCDKHDCVREGEEILFPTGELLTNLLQHPQNGLHHFALIREEETTVSIGEGKIFVLKEAFEHPRHPDFLPYLVRSMRSLRERIIWNVVTEDDPTSDYLWGSGTWPRCYSVLCLDLYGMSEEAFGYMEYLFRVSKQFKERDGLCHLFDSFTLNGTPRFGGTPRGVQLYDINGHAIKLFEMGKFYLSHQKDGYGEQLRTLYYPILRDFGLWIERHTNDDGLVLDVTESNTWSLGYGVFTQAPCIAGLHLLQQISYEAGEKADADHFALLESRLLKGLETHLYGPCTNPFLGIDGSEGEAYITYLPKEENQHFDSDQSGMPDVPIGLSCYSAAAAFFLCDPDVRLLDAQSERVSSTSHLIAQLLGDEFDPRVPKWHVGSPPHLGYGLCQLLFSKCYEGDTQTVDDLLDALFSISHREPGDPYLMQEVANREGLPNRGNKAHLTYFPLLAHELKKRGYLF